MLCQSAEALHILDLPNEILAQIFTYVRGAPYHSNKHPFPGISRYRDGGPREIKATRLVCRKFCDASSHLLLPAISVSMIHSSLERLDKISRHPLISKGVYTVRVVVSFLASKLAKEFHHTYLPYQLENLVDTASRHETSARDPVSGWAGHANSKAAHKSGSLMDAWSQLLSDMPQEIMSEQHQEEAQFIEHAHHLYRMAYLKQEWMLSDGYFVREIADAVARMPAARFLYITDFDRHAPPDVTSFVQRMEKPSLLIKNMNQPMGWRNAVECDFGSPPVELLSQIPLAIYRKGVMLVGVDYEVIPLDGSSRLFGPDYKQDLHDLKAAMQQLTSFRFGSGLESALDMRDEEKWVEPVKDFLTCFTDTDSLEEIVIDTNFLWWHNQKPLLSTGSFLATNRAWPQLRSVCFTGTLRFEELEKFCDKFQGRVKLRLSRVHLLSGSWVAVLDTLRAHTTPPRPVCYVDDPRGKEGDDLPRRLLGTIFGDYYNSLANQYIRGEVSINPLKSITGVEDAFEAVAL